MIKQGTRRFIGVALGLSLLAGNIPAIAVEINQPGGSGSSDLTLKISDDSRLDIFSVIIPTTLPLAMNLEGEVKVPTDAKLINQSDKDVTVTDIAVTLESGWELAALASEGSDTIDLEFRGDTLNEQGLLELTPLNWVIEGNGNLPLDIAASIKTELVEKEVAKIATVEFTLDWHIPVIDNTHTVYIEQGQASEIEGNTASIETDISGKITNLPNVVPSDGYIFKHWEDVETGLEVYIGDILNQDITIRPVFEIKAPEMVAVQFESGFNGELSSADKIQVEEGTTWASLDKPTPSSKCGIFVGWFNGDELITDTDIITKDTIAMAKFDSYYTYSGSSITGLSDAFKALEVEGATPSEILIPSSIDGMSMDTLAFPRILFKDKQIDKIEVEEGIINLNDYTFEYTLATQIILPDSIETLGDSCFSRASTKDIHWPSNLKSVGEYCFYEATGIDTGTILAGVEYGERVYTDSSISEIYIEDGVKLIPANAFSGCLGLQGTIEVPGIPDIANYAFSGCENITNIILNEGTETIGYGALRFLGITSITLPSTVTSIGASLLSGNSKLTNIDFSKSKITNVPGELCNGNSQAFSVKLPETVVKIDGWAFSSTGISSINIPSSCTEIGQRAFQYPSYLKSLRIPSTVKTVGDSAFWNMEQIYYSGPATGAPWGAKSLKS